MESRNIRVLRIWSLDLCGKRLQAPRHSEISEELISASSPNQVETSRPSSSLINAS